MTSIAFDKKIMTVACDTRLSDGTYVISDKATKYHIFRDRYLMIMAGHVYLFHQMIDKLHDFLVSPKNTLKGGKSILLQKNDPSDNFHGMVIDAKTGTVLECDNGCFFKSECRFLTFGRPWEYLRGAMDAGVSPSTAVRMAMKAAPGSTGGKVVTFRIVRNKILKSVR